MLARAGLLGSASGRCHALPGLLRVRLLTLQRSNALLLVASRCSLRFLRGLLQQGIWRGS
jgi:hypothetical protein